VNYGKESNKKNYGKKPVVKKTVEKTGTGKTQFLAKPKTVKSAMQTTTRRPPNNADMPQNTIDALNMELNNILEILDSYSQHLRALDRRRLNGVGMKKLGFIERAYELALENPEFLPYYLTIERFGDDIHYFTSFQSLVDLTMQLREKFWNITIQSADRELLGFFRAHG